MKTKHIREIIGSIDILSQGEQISFVMTNLGSYVVGCIPDATSDSNLWRKYILAKVDSIDEAKTWFRMSAY